ncbi:Gfo/Idh/MocA family oxidoreductase [Ferrovibrio sp.]|uniref:Gfo/Idh/MocA family protein n=1 Tax=Ferrovibrio sp. TaxID=1917215 RepID=UPI0025C2787C|nr:Gfo/Idh/MocA family oxidoreductase [Ferrovibrio sp.]MBX3454244.1 Gfo/Idh/MocA family oxidoreductase [Ferrovibrio sp.]
MRIVVVGLGVQGYKRRSAAGASCIATIDPINAEASYRDIRDVPLADYDAALVCTPDGAKLSLLRYLLENGKHVLVEKPLGAEDDAALRELQSIAERKRVLCYTAYNHRFEPHFARMREVIASGVLGRIYSVRLFYGNGTARLVRESVWRDKGAGVLPDLGSHLLDTVLYWFGANLGLPRMISARRFENAAYDHVVFALDGDIHIEMEMTLLSWRNHFSADIMAEKGSAHISSLCKWGPASFTLRDRKLPSGRPDEETSVLTMPDPTWALEYAEFCRRCSDPAAHGFGNIGNDLWINGHLRHLTDKVS